MLLFYSLFLLLESVMFESNTFLLLFFNSRFLLLESDIDFFLFLTDSALGRSQICNLNAKEIISTIKMTT